jgi:hypothetical protein
VFGKQGAAEEVADGPRLRRPLQRVRQAPRLRGLKLWLQQRALQAEPAPADADVEAPAAVVHR